MGEPIIRKSEVNIKPTISKQYICVEQSQIASKIHSNIGRCGTLDKRKTGQLNYEKCVKLKTINTYNASQN